MTSLMLYQRLCASGKLLKYNLNHKVLQPFRSVNIRNIHSVKEPILKNKCLFCVPKRNFYGLFRKKTMQQLKIKDDVPDQYILIYRSMMDKYIFLAQIITSVTAFIVIVTTIIKNDYLNVELDTSLFKSQPRQTENEMYVYVATFAIIVAVLQVMVSRLPIRIYNLPQQKNYIFVFRGNYPLTHRKAVCKAGDVIPIPESGILPWNDARYLIKHQQKLILLDKYFRRPADLYIMIGVQKDPDVDEKE